MTKIKEVTEKVTKFLGTHRMPFIVFDMPEAAKDFDLGFDDVKQTVTNNRVFSSFEDSSEDRKKFLKKIEKAFCEMNLLDNELSITASLYDFETIAGKILGHYISPMVALTERLKVEASLSVDKNIYKTFGELARKLSPEFAESPIMAILPLLDAL